MFLVAAEANTSAGAPLLICSARAELAPKLNFTVSPGWAASNCLPSSVNVPISEAAASTVIVPVCAAELLAAGVDELLEPEAVLDELLLEQPATAIAASAKRRMLTPWLHLRGRDLLVGDLSPVLPMTGRPGRVQPGPGERHPVHSELRERPAASWRRQGSSLDIAIDSCVTQGIQTSLW